MSEALSSEASSEASSGDSDPESRETARHGTNADNAADSGDDEDRIRNRPKISVLSFLQNNEHRLGTHQQRTHQARVPIHALSKIATSSYLGAVVQLKQP